jgi:DNA-binding transcriptional LysR family regulator
VRLVTPRLAAMMVIAPKMNGFAQDYPDIVLDVTTDESPMDIVAGGYDAGIHFGEYIQKDMIAVKVSGDQRAAIVGSATYFKSNPKPKTPRDLTSHRCNYRHGAGGEVYRWEFERGKKGIVRGGERTAHCAWSFWSAPRLTASGSRSCQRNSLANIWSAEHSYLRWRIGASRFPGFFLYYPSRRQQPAALSALINIPRL